MYRLPSNRTTRPRSSASSSRSSDAVNPFDGFFVSPGLVTERAVQRVELRVVDAEFLARSRASSASMFLNLPLVDAAEENQRGGVVTASALVLRFLNPRVDAFVGEVAVVDAVERLFLTRVRADRLFVAVADALVPSPGAGPVSGSASCANPWKAMAMPSASVTSTRFMTCAFSSPDSSDSAL
jgi:hypothetical protein